MSKAGILPVSVLIIQQLCVSYYNISFFHRSVSYTLANVTQASLLTIYFVIYSEAESHMRLRSLSRAYSELVEFSRMVRTKSYSLLNFVNKTCLLFHQGHLQNLNQSSYCSSLSLKILYEDFKCFCPLIVVQLSVSFCKFCWSVFVAKIGYIWVVVHQSISHNLTQPVRKSLTVTY